MNQYLKKKCDELHIRFDQELIKELKDEVRSDSE
jgi:hypothetical protein